MAIWHHLKTLEGNAWQCAVGNEQLAMLSLVNVPSQIRPCIQSSISSPDMFHKTLTPNYLHKSRSIWTTKALALQIPNVRSACRVLAGSLRQHHTMATAHFEEALCDSDRLPARRFCVHHRLFNLLGHRFEVTPHDVPLRRGLDFTKNWPKAQAVEPSSNKTNTFNQEIP